MAAAAVALAALLVACGPGGEEEPAAAIDHLRYRYVVGDASPVIGEVWEYRPSDGCWRSRVELRDADGVIMREISTIVPGADGEGRRRMERRERRGESARTRYPHDDPACGARGKAPTKIAVLRQLAEAGAMRRVATERRGELLLDVLAGPAELAVFGDPRLDRERRDGLVDAVPADAEARLVYEPGTRRPVSLWVPPTVIAPADEDAGPDRHVAAQEMRYSVVQEIPADPSGLAVFDPPVAAPGVSTG